MNWTYCFGAGKMEEYSNKKFHVTIISEYDEARGPAAKIIMTAMARKITEERGIEGRLVVDSAGLRNPRYGRMVSYMDSALRKKGYDPSTHLPKRIPRNFPSREGIVLCMERDEVSETIRTYPDLGMLIETLPHFARSAQREIPNPGGFVKRRLPKFEEMPVKFLAVLLSNIGKINGADINKVLREYDSLVGVIGLYAELALDRMEKEYGIFS